MQRSSAHNNHNGTIISINQEDLKTGYHLPINDAAKKFGICVTVLKQRCRELGVVRWPFRKVKKIDTLIKQLEEEKERLLLLSAAKNNENESNIDDNNRHCLFLLEDIEKRLVDARKMREELYLDPNSNVHLVAAAMKPTMSASNCGGTSNNNNENTSNSNDIKKQAKQNRGLLKRFFANKKSLSKKTLPTTTTTTISGKDEDSDSGELITNNNNTVINAPIIIPQQQQQQQQELVRKSLGVPCKSNAFKRRSVELTRNSVELTRQSSGDKGGQLFDALLDAASALDDDDEPVKLKGITSKDIRTPRTSSENEKDEDYQWGRKSSNDDDEKDNADDNNGALGSPRKARRSCDILQHSIRPPSLDLGNQARPTSEPANIEAELQRLYHQHAQNAATYQAIQQALLAQHSAFMMNPHHMAMNMPMMYQTPQQSFQYMQLNAQLMLMQWGYAVNNGGGGMATTSDVTINGRRLMSLLERRAFEAASVPSSLNLNLQPLGGEKSLVEPPTSDDDDESSGNEGDDDNKSAVGTPKSTNSFPPSARSSFDIPSPSVQILHGGAGVGLHKPLAARAGFVPVNKKM